MSFFDNYDSLGKDTITATRSDFTKSVGVEGTKDIITSVLLGGNVRDVTEFITQRRLLNSYAAMLKLFTEDLGDASSSVDKYTKKVTSELKHSKADEKVFDLWLLGLTKKGFDNIVRGKDNIDQYGNSFSFSIQEAIEDFESQYGEISGTIKLGNKEIDVNWTLLSLLFIAIGSQTLTIRGSSKSMNGKMFEKLVLGSILSIMGFTYCPEPPLTVSMTQKLFWLSNMDENERETDATIIYNGIAISIDIGFIGRGNPEITLDKVTRFGAYKHIGGIKHDMSTIIIVDTVGEHSDLFNKAARVNGSVLQMKDPDWLLQFAKLICQKYSLTHELQTTDTKDLPAYLSNAMKNIDITKFLM